MADCSRDGFLAGALAVVGAVELVLAAGAACADAGLLGATLFCCCVAAALEPKVPFDALLFAFFAYTLLEKIMEIKIIKSIFFILLYKNNQNR